MRLLLIAVLLALPLALSGCGKKGPPEAPEDSSYPRTYPAY